MQKKLLTLALLLAAATAATAQIAVNGSGNTRTFEMPAYDVEVTTELWYKLDATQTFADNVTAYGSKTDFFLDRTLTQNVWNTFASPIAIAAGDMTMNFGEHAKVRKLASSTLVDGVLTINFEDATSIEAGKPYLIKPTDFDVVDLCLSTADLSSATATAEETDYVDFVPALGKTLVTGYTGFESDPRSVLFLNTSNKLIHPTVVNDATAENDASYIRGFRGYFRLHNRVNGGAVSARAYSINFGDDETTDIIAVEGSRFTVNDEPSTIYDLQGRKVENATKKGIYIQNGKKVVIK